MPVRKLPLVTGEVYHIFNRGVNKMPTFKSRKEYDRAKMACDFYRFVDPGISLSGFLDLTLKRQLELRKLAEKSGLLVDIFAYCLMPNHFHFLLRQNVDGGIAKFVGNFQNSHSKYFNLRNKRQGPLFLPPFQGVRIEDDSQFVHVGRYIHLNPHTAYLVKSMEELKEYAWSSLCEYLNPNNGGFCKVDEMLEMFESSDDYLNFLSDQADYQRELKQIEHLLLE